MIARFFDPNSRLSYRRLFAFCVATGLLAAHVIGEDTWMVVTAAFIAAEGTERVVRLATQPSAPVG